MLKVEYEDMQPIEVPEFEVTSSSGEKPKFSFSIKIIEGEFDGCEIAYSDVQVDEKDDAVINFTLDIVQSNGVDEAELQQLAKQYMLYFITATAVETIENSKKV